MIKLLRFLITGSWHEHKYKIIKEVQVTSNSGRSWVRYISRCEECGKIKTNNTCDKW